MKETNLESEKLITIGQGTEVKVLNVLNCGWSYVYASNRKGYVLSEGLSNINPIKNEEEVEEKIEIELSKDELLEKLSFDMDISKPSGFSLEQFRKVLSNKKSDKNNIFEKNSDYFYYAEKEYGINGIFLASLAIHESGWGTSSIALNKKNLFGYQAYDKNPYSFSKQFDSYSEGIDLVARVLVKYYLNDNGTKIFGGDIADGRYYSGSTIKSVNKHYATDSNWSNAIFSIMKGLYNDL